MAVDNIYKRLFDLLATSHGAGVAAIASSSNRTLRRELVLVAKKEGCLPDVHAQWDAAGLLSPSESAEHELARRDREAAAGVARAFPAGAVLLSGAALARHWPQGVTRRAADLEVLLPDFGAVGLLHDAVKGRGFRLRGAGRWHVPLRDPMHRGSASYRYWAANTYESSLVIDVHVAGVPVDERRILAFSDLAEKATRLEGLACLGLHPMRQLLQLIAGFAAADAPITVRQIVDLHHLLKAQGSQADHAQLLRRVEQWNLWSGLAKLREAIVAKRLSSAIDWGAFGRMVAVSAERAEAAAQRAARAPGPRRDGRAAPRGERLAAMVTRAFAMLAGPRADDLASRAARMPWAVSAALAAGHRVHGVPLPSKGASAPQLLRIDGALYLATGAGLFLLSLVDLTDAARVGMAQRIRTASRPVVLARWSGAASR